MLLAEVLSPPTRETDLGIKVWEYQRIPSVNDYLIIEQETPLVIHHSRNERGWQMIEYTGLDASIALPRFEMDLTLADIYAQIAFADAPDD